MTLIVVFRLNPEIKMPQNEKSAQKTPWSRLEYVGKIKYSRSDTALVAPTHTSAKLIEIRIKFLQPKHSPHGTVRQMESNETPHTPRGLRHL